MKPDEERGELNLYETSSSYKMTQWKYDFMSHTRLLFLHLSQLSPTIKKSFNGSLTSMKVSAIFIYVCIYVSYLTHFRVWAKLIRLNH